MANWASLVDYVNRNYKIADQNDTMVKLIFNTGDLRSQVIFVWKSSLMNGAEEWVTFESPFAEIAQVDLGTVLKEASNLVCGGLGLVGSMLTLRHSVPLQNARSQRDRPATCADQWKCGPSGAPVRRHGSVLSPSPGLTTGRTRSGDTASSGLSSACPSM